MLDAHLYLGIYLCAITILTIPMVLKYAELGNPYCRQLDVVKSRNTSLIVTSILIIIFLGFRPISGVFVDMRNYEDLYYFYQLHNIGPNLSVDNLIFDNGFRLLAINYIDIRFFFVIVACIYIGCMAFALKRIFPRDAFYAFIIYLAAFSTYTFGTNGIKAGAAASIFLLSLSYYPDRKFTCLILALLSFGFHHSMQLPVAALLICMFYKNTNFYIALWFLCLFISMAHITYFQSLFGSMTDEHGAGYLMGSSEGVMRKSGFRYDFVIYSFIQIVIGWWARKKNPNMSTSYTFFYNIYLFVNAIWLLCIYAPFTNRIAYLSWQLLPLISIFPFFNMNLHSSGQYRILNRVVIVYLLFTLLYNVI